MSRNTDGKMVRLLSRVELTFGLLKPTKKRQLTTYYEVVEWRGRLTGKLYHMVKDDYVEGEFTARRQS